MIIAKLIVICHENMLYVTADAEMGFFAKKKAFFKPENTSTYTNYHVLIQMYLYWVNNCEKNRTKNIDDEICDISSFWANSRFRG